jgi:hypothetical protein
LKKTSLGPLRQGQWLDTSETKTKLKQRARTTGPKLKHHKELPLHTCKLPLNQCTSPWTNACNPAENRAAAVTSAHTGQIGHHHRSDRCLRCAQDQHSHRSDRLPRPVDRCTTEPRNGSKSPENLLNVSSKPFQAQPSPPCWQCMNQAKNAKFST